MPVSLSWCTSASICLVCQFPISLCDDMQTTFKWLSLPHSPHFFRQEGHCQSICPVSQYMHFSLYEVSHACLWVFCQIASNSLAFLMPMNVLHWALCTSTLCAQVNMHSLVASSMLPNLLPCSISHLSCHHHLAYL